MPINLATGNLLSRRIRSNAVSGVQGAGLLNAATAAGQIRKIGSLTKLTGTSGGDSGIVGWVWDKAKNMAGFIGGLIKGIAFTATAVFEWLINRIEQLKQFNWNASDDELRKMIEGQNTAIAALWGGVVGQGLGWLAAIGVGYGVSMIVPVIGGAMLARTVATNTGREAIEELSPTLFAAIYSTAGAVANTALINAYMGYRNFLKSLSNDLLKGVYGDEGASFIKNVWGRKGAPDASFNVQMEEFVEGIPNKLLQTFIESMLEESWDSFVEGGFVVASEIDAAYSQHRISQKQQFGQERSLTLQPNVQTEDEKLTFIKMPQKLLIPTVQQTLNAHRLIYNRDLGQLVGQPAEDWARGKPQLRKLVVVFRSKEKPPWISPGGKASKQISYTIPDAKVGLGWGEIKAAANPYLWGKYRATAALDDNRQMAVYGATADEAEQKLRELLRLSTAELLTLSVTEERDRHPNLKKEITRMYPAYATLLIRRPSTDLSGRNDLSGNNWKEEHIRLDLWLDKEPPNLPPLY